jgi:hypothetical protein
MISSSMPDRIEPAGDVLKAGRDGGVPGDDAAAGQALGEDDVVDPLRVEPVRGGADHVVGEVERGRVAQRPLVRGADGGPQRGQDDSFRHGRAPTRLG